MPPMRAGGEGSVEDHSEGGEAITQVGRYWGSPCDTLHGGSDSKQGTGGDSVDSESRRPSVRSGSSEVLLAEGGYP
jgi:hypothetical protein